MSDTTQQGHNVTDLPVRTDAAGITLVGFEAGGVPVALDPLASGLGGTGGGGGVELTTTPPANLGSAAQAGTATTAARADHVHQRPTPAQIGAAAVSHAHSIADVTGLRGELDALADQSGVGLATTLPADLGADPELGASVEAARADHVHRRPTAAEIGAAPAAHAHAMGDITGLQGALDGKQSTAQRGQANGYAPLDAGGKVPSANLPASMSTANLQNGAVAGQVPVWDPADSRYEPQTPDDITAVRIQSVEINAGLALTFAAHNGRNLVLTASTPLTLAVGEAGVSPNLGMDFIVQNEHTASNTLTFAAGFVVKRMAGTEGTGQSVTIPPDGMLSCIVYPKGAAVVAKVTVSGP